MEQLLSPLLQALPILPSPVLVLVPACLVDVMRLIPRLLRMKLPQLLKVVVELDAPRRLGVAEAEQTLN